MKLFLTKNYLKLCFPQQLLIYLSTILLFSLYKISTINSQANSIVYKLPHFNKIDNIEPVFKLAVNPKYNVSIVLGIPTIKRDKDNYLYDTINSLIFNMSPFEQNDTLIIIFIGETDLTLVRNYSIFIEEKYKPYVNSGLIEIISPPKSFYPNFTNMGTDHIFHDPNDRQKWRTKQNLDYSFLMMYAKDRGAFYVQLEDDILTKKNFITILNNTARQPEDPNIVPWFMYDFCQLGFIGKMFKNADLPILYEFLILFNEDKPCDYLIIDLIKTKFCEPDGDCSITLRRVRKSLKPSLFQHRGDFSSLPGKIQKMKDITFEIEAHKDNPPADVICDLPIYDRHNLKDAYIGKTFFWGMDPKVGDKIIFNFKKPVNINGFSFHSGSTNSPGDCFKNTTIEILPETDISNDKELHLTKTTDNYLIVGEFANCRASENINKKLNPIKSLRLHIHSNLTNWVILNEIFINVLN